MDLEQAVYQALAVGSPLTAAGVRVYPEPAAQGAALPYITWQRASTAPVTSLSGSSGLDSVRIQVDCWASSKPAARQLATQVRTILEGQSFKALMQGAFATYETETRVHRYSMDFRCWEHLS